MKTTFQPSEVASPAQSRPDAPARFAASTLAATTPDRARKRPPPVNAASLPATVEPITRRRPLLWMPPPSPAATFPEIVDVRNDSVPML